MIKCIIIEDEKLAQEVIVRHLEQSGQFSLLGCYRNAPEATLALKQHEVDLIFLDIQLPGMTGLHFLRTLTAPPLVVFTTSYPEYALESYEFNVIDYLLKPISYERFSKTVDKINEWDIFSPSAAGLPPVSRDHIFIRSKSRFLRVLFSEIIYIEGMKDYLKIHTTDQVIMTHQTMGEMEQLLPAAQFIRIHKSYVAGIGKIKSIFGNSVDMGAVLLPIGLNYKDGVMRFIDGRPQ